MKPKSFNLNSFLISIVLALIAWGGNTLVSLRREVDVIKVQLADYRQAVDDKFTVLKTGDEKRDVMLGQIQLEISRLRRTAPPKQTP